MASAENPSDRLEAPPAEGEPTARGTGLPPISPDVVEQDQGDEFDDIVPSRSYDFLPVVALGGSAGSVPALQRFFKGMPADTGMAFVVVLHLAAEHESILDEILGRSTTMRVVQPADDEPIRANTVYVIPPGKYISAHNGSLRLTPLEAERGKRIAVDLFFRTLADTHGPGATAIILSGADGDGALGIKRMKERGGLTIAQDPEEAEHPSMPRSAIDTGMVDWVLPVDEMPARLVAYRENARRLTLPSEDGPQPAKERPASPDGDESALHEVLVHLRTRTGRDFSYYKRATILRRISRRMQVNSVASLPEYLLFLRTHAGEAGALQQDLLISVTNFFRDREAFDALEREIPMLFAGKGPSDVVRVWTAGCATGEEAYSVAMLLLEEAGRMEAPPAIQVFATDLAEEVVQSARDGLYGFTMHADVSQERLARFFVKEHCGHRARRELRECVLFAVHDLLKDAPFSRLDLFTCRNLLIYLTAEAQRRVFDIAHFALKPEALLFIGTSEAVDEESGLWTSVDKKHRLYRQRPSNRPLLIAPLGPTTLGRAVAAQDRAKGGPYLHGPAFSAALATAQLQDAELRERQQVSWAELHFKLIERFAPPSLVVTRDYDIAHMSENAGQFLQFTGGEPTVNLLRVVHPMLRIELRAALFRAAQTSLPVEVFRVPVELDGQAVAVDIRVSPAQEIAPDYQLVVFAVREPADSEAVQARQEAEPAVRHLERELEQMKTRLRDTIEQYETSCEELKAGNEELQAMNEELRSSTEELETSREELQSVNEELTTVNQELKSKVDDLAGSNADLANLMTATGVATIFLDRELHIMRYTPGAVALFRLIPSDVSRPLTDLNHKLNYPELKADAESVLASLMPSKREVTDGEHWFLAQLLPYRTGDDHIAGVVLTFVDITDARKTQETLHELAAANEAQLQTFNAFVASTQDFIYHFDLEGRFTFANQPLLDLLQISATEIVGKDFYDLTYPPELAERLQQQIQEVIAYQQPVRGRMPFTSAGGEREYEYIFSPLMRADGSVSAVAGVTRDTTDQTMAEAALRLSEERFRLVVENAREYAIFGTNLEGFVTLWNMGAEHILGYHEAEIVGQNAEIIFTPEDRAAGASPEEMRVALAEGRAADERWHVRKDGSRFWGSGFLMAMRDLSGEAVGFVKILRDETLARETQQALEDSRQQLWDALQENEHARAEVEAASQAKDRFLAILSHELRTPLTPVLMATHALARRQDLPEEVRDGLEMIRRNVQIEAHFIDDLLDLTRIGRGKFEIFREPTDLHEQIRRAIEITDNDLVARGQRLRVSLGARHHQLFGDATRLQQVIWNLLKNASKISPQGAEITLTTRNEDRLIVVAVSDCGVGISHEQLPTIFDAFTQASEEITRKFGGLGLGLAISKATIDAHEGFIFAESAGVGQGATLTVTLPLDTPLPPE